MSDIRDNNDPAAIEQDIRRTQDSMSRTVDKIGDQLTMKNLFNSLLDKADENGVDAHYLVDGARRNPMALGLIAAGAIWLVSDKDSKFPSLPSGRGKTGAKGQFEYDDADTHHRDYVSHMSSLEMRDGEDPAAYQRRRDTHRASFLMCERKPDEDEHGFRQRLDDLTDKFREKRRAWSDTASQAGSSAASSAQSMANTAQQTASQVSGRAQQMYSSNPLIGGIIAAAVGAALGSGLPVTRQEQEKLGDLGAKARDVASEQTNQLIDQAKDKKDELVEKADQKIQSSSPTNPGQQSNHVSGSSEDGQSGPSDRPFMIAEPTR